MQLGNVVVYISFQPRRVQKSGAIGNESVPKIVINDTMIIFLELQLAFCQFRIITVFGCCLIKLLPYVLFEKYVNVIVITDNAFEKASPGNRHCSL